MVDVVDECVEEVLLNHVEGICLSIGLVLTVGGIVLTVVGLDIIVGLKITVGLSQHEVVLTPNPKEE